MVVVVVLVVVLVVVVVVVSATVVVVVVGTGAGVHAASKATHAANRTTRSEPCFRMIGVPRPEMAEICHTHGVTEFRSHCYE